MSSCGQLGQALLSPVRTGETFGECRIRAHEKETLTMHPSEGSIWRHEKTGHYYVVLGLCRLEATDKAAVRYKRTLPLPSDLRNNPRRRDTAHWIRPLSEFLDGRFTEVTELRLVGRDQDHDALIDSLKARIAALSKQLRVAKSRYQAAEAEFVEGER